MVHIVNFSSLAKKNKILFPLIVANLAEDLDRKLERKSPEISVIIVVKV